MLSAITKRAALSEPVRTVSSRSMPSPTLIGVVVAATRTTSFWITTASPTRVCACAQGAAHKAADNSVEKSQKRKFIRNRSICP
ncbi:hypothetical protein ACVWZZ_006383 [Bradyrhizobium sp. LM6.10]